MEASERAKGASSRSTSWLKATAMKLCAPRASFGSTPGLSKTRTRSRYAASSSPPSLLKSWDRNASASSTESAAIMVGPSAGLDNRAVIVRVAAAIAGLNKAAARGGSAAQAQSVQHRSSERTSSDGRSVVVSPIVV